MSQSNELPATSPASDCYASTKRFAVNDAVIVTDEFNRRSLRRIVGVTESGQAFVWRTAGHDSEVLMQADDWLIVGRYVKSWFGDLKFKNA